MKRKNKKDVIRAIAMILLVLLLLSVAVLFAGCALEVSAAGTHRAIILLPSGEKIEGVVTDTRRWDYGVVEIAIDGKTYKTHWSNVVLISE